MHQVVVEAFADKGVVRLLTKKMQLCEEESQGASARSASRIKKARSTRKAATASVEATAGSVLEEPSTCQAKASSRSLIGKVDGDTRRNKTGIGQEWLQSFQARPLQEKNTRVLPFDHDVGADDAQKRSLVRGCDEPSPPTSTMDLNTESTVPYPLGLERGGYGDVDGCARTDLVGEAKGGCLEHQRTPAIIRYIKAAGDDTKGSIDVADAAAEKVNDGTSDGMTYSSPLSSCKGIGDGLATRARSIRDGDFVRKQPNTSDDGPATTVRLLPRGDCPHVVSTPSHHRAANFWRSPGATTVSDTGGAGSTVSPFSAGVESIQSIARAEASTAATRVLVESHVSVEDGELGSLLSTFERQVKRGAELVRRFEGAGKPSLELDDDVKAEGGNLERGNMDLPIMTPSSTSIEEKRRVEGASIARIAAVTPSSDVQMESDREPERTEKVSNEALLYLSGVAEPPSIGGVESINRSLPGLADQKNRSPDTNTTLDVDSEDYEFTFDDEEVVVGQKSVQFTDESRWSTHEVRACFEQHELGELFYTTAELDSMFKEAESETLERSSARVSQAEELAEDTAAVDGGSVSLSSLARDKVPTSSGADEIVSFEKVSFDDEDSDYDF